MPDETGKKYGEQLFAEVIRQAKAQDERRLWLDVQTVYCVRDEGTDDGIVAQGRRRLPGASLRTGEAVRRERQ